MTDGMEALREEIRKLGRGLADLEETLTIITPLAVDLTLLVAGENAKKVGGSMKITEATGPEPKQVADDLVEAVQALKEARLVEALHETITALHAARRIAMTEKEPNAAIGWAEYWASVGELAKLLDRQVTIEEVDSLARVLKIHPPERPSLCARCGKLAPLHDTICGACGEDLRQEAMASEPLDPSIVAETEDF